MTQTPTEPTLNGSTPGREGISPAELYKFIIDGIPYRYDGDEPRFTTRADKPPKGERTPAVTGPGGMLYDVSGPAADNDSGAPLSAKDEKRILQKEGQKGLWWHFDDRYYRVTKALRIPYIVYQDDGHGNKKPVTKHMFIGYAGIDGAGG